MTNDLHCECGRPALPDSPYCEPCGQKLQLALTAQRLNAAVQLADLQRASHYSQLTPITLYERRLFSMLRELQAAVKGEPFSAKGEPFSAGSEDCKPDVREEATDYKA